jgi:hypothetical protein
VGKTIQETMKEITLQEAALAWAQGKRVEATPKSHDDWTLITRVGLKTNADEYSSGVFAMSEYLFRLTPEPPAKRYRPWTPEEVPVGALTKPNHGGDVLMIIGRFSNGALLAGDRAVYPFGDLLKLRQHSLDNGKTWLPCGAEVEA